MSSAWEPHDDGHGHTYYFNTETGETSWDAPGSTEHHEAPQDAAAVHAVGAAWHVMVEEASGEPYFYNVQTGELTWEKPPGYDGPPIAGSHDYAAADADAAAAAAAQEPPEMRAFMAQLMGGKLKSTDPARAENVKKALAAHTEAKGARDKKAEEGHGHWVEVYDPASHQFYYCDSHTHEVRWDKPEHYVMACDDAEMHAVILVQTMWRAQDGRRQTKARKARVEAGAKADPVWYICDDHHEHRYYYNKVTHECVWEKPADFDGTDTLDPRIQRESEAYAEELAGQLLRRAMRTSAEGKKKVQDALAAHSEAKGARDKKAEEGHGHWVEVYDPASHQFYYCDSHTHEVRWDKPEHYVMACDDAEMHAVILVQTTWRAQDGRRQTTARKTRVEAGAKADPVWYICDDHHEHRYYYNSKTHVCVWEKPADFDGTDTPDPRIQRESEAYTEPHADELAKADTGAKEESAEVQLGAESAAPEPKGTASAAEDKEGEGSAPDADDATPRAAQKPAEPAKDADPPLLTASGQGGTASQQGDDQAPAKDVEPSAKVPEDAMGATKMEQVAGDEPAATPSDDGKAEDTAKSVRAVARHATRVAQREAAKTAQASGELRWASCYDPVHDAWYYYCINTHEVSWEEPDGFVKAVHDEEMDAAIALQAAWQRRKRSLNAMSAPPAGVGKDKPGCFGDALLTHGRGPALCTVTGELAPSPSPAKRERSEKLHMLEMNETMLEAQRIMEAKMEQQGLEEEAARAQVELMALRRERQTKQRAKRLKARAERVAKQEAEAAERTAADVAAEEARWKQLVASRKERLHSRRAARDARRAEKLKVAKAGATARAGQEMAQHEARLAAEHEAEQQLVRMRARRELDARCRRQEWAAECEVLNQHVRVGNVAAQRMHSRARERQQRASTASDAAAVARHRNTAARQKRQGMECGTVWQVLAASSCCEFSSGDATLFNELLPSLERGAGVGVVGVGARNADGDTLLHAAAQGGALGAVRSLLEAGADVQAIGTTKLQITPLHEAAAHGNPDVCTALLAKDADLYARDASGATPLHACARNGNYAAARTLLRSAGMGAGTPSSTPAGWTKLLAVPDGKGRTAAQLCEARGSKRSSAMRELLLGEVPAQTKNSAAADPRSQLPAAASPAVEEAQPPPASDSGAGASTSLQPITAGSWAQRGQQQVQPGRKRQVRSGMDPALRKKAGRAKHGLK